MVEHLPGNLNALSSVFSTAIENEMDKTIT
jgi:hypothetical protein